MMKLLFMLFLIPGISFGEELKLMTWNVFMLPKPVRFSHQELRTPAIAELLMKSDYDLIFLQEAFISSFQTTLKKTLQSKYPHFLRLKKKPGFFPIIGPGLVVLSKHPMKAIDHIYFSRCAVADCFASKGAQLVEVTFPSGKRIQIANTHMQSGLQHAEIRKVQLDEIKKLLRQHKTKSIPQLLVGDLNIDSTRGEEFTGSLTMLEMHPFRRDQILQANPKGIEGKIPVIERAIDFFSAGYSVPCLKDSKEPNPKLLDHVLFYDLDGQIKFKDDQIIFPEFPLNGKGCSLSDHRPRIVTLEF